MSDDIAARAGRTLDLQQVIDRQPNARRHLPLLVMMTLIMFVDGYDVFMLGRIAPAIADEFHEPAVALTLVFVLQQAGLAVGSFLISPFSDRFGRKTLLMISAAAFGVLTILVVFAHSLAEVAALRGLAGLFLAGIIPNAAAMLTEFTPPSRRASFVSIAFTGYTLGGAAASFAAITLLADFGWRSAFWVGGVVPLLFVPLFALFGQESLQFRARRDPTDPVLKSALLLIDPELSMDGVTGFRVGPEDGRRARRGAIASLFSIFEGRVSVTLLLWAAYFVALGVISLLASWMSTFWLKLDGISLAESAKYSLLSFAGGVVGTTTVGFLMDRLGRARVLAVLFMVDAATLALMGSVPFGGTPFIVLTLIWGYCQAGGQGGLNALCAQAYPSENRSTGVGWAFGMGRFGGVVLPALGGLALGSGLSLQWSFALAGALPLLVALTLVGLGRLDAQGRFAQ